MAVIGTGRMGGAMASSIVRGGFDVVLWNRDPSKSERLAASLDMPVAATAAEAASKADVVVTSLADDAALERVYLGDERRRRRPEARHRRARHQHGRSARRSRTWATRSTRPAPGFLDCPVSGSVSAVEAGTLTIMVGGEAHLLERVRPVLDTLASRVIHVGARGAGAATKLAVNGLVHGLNVALSEALVLAERAGVDRTTAYEVFASGAGGAPFVQYKREAYEHPDDVPVAFSLDLVEKDLELITGLGDRVQAPMRQAKTSLDIVHRAVEDGFGERDLSAVAVFLRGEAP